jgi:hypothetical protein
MRIFAVPAVNPSPSVDPELASYQSFYWHLAGNPLLRLLLLSLSKLKGGEGDEGRIDRSGAADPFHFQVWLGSGLPRPGQDGPGRARKLLDHSPISK